ncbi:MAG: hypothetical protein LIP77_00090 [Planctomycetes bacterium]|nr:hypothetical protein [Planctomycetota bacterium]
MNMLREFFTYFFSVIMGRRDSLTAFLESLTMGERYLRWGMESRDIRDFRAAADHLHLCRDRDAPMASLLVRKYNCLGDITTAAVETLLMRHQKVVDDAAKTETGYRTEMEYLQKKAGESRDYAQKLVDRGDPLQAGIEERRAAEMDANATRLREMLDTGEGRTAVFESYDAITADAARFFRELDQAATLVTANTTLGATEAETLSSQLRNKLGYLRDRLDKASPLPAAPAPADGRRPGGSRARARTAPA